MFDMCLTKTVCILATMVTLAAATPFGGELPEGVLKGSLAAFSLRNPSVRIVLGVVSARQEVPIPAATGRRRVTYDVTIQCDYRGQLAEGARAKIQGQLGMQSAGGQQIPLMQPRTTFVMACRTTADPGLFDYLGPARIIGLSTPCEVRAADAPLISSALTRLGEVAATPELMLSRQDAQKL